MLQNDRLLRALRRQPVDRTPVWIMRQAGRYLPEYRAIRSKVDFLTLCKTPDLAAEVSIQPVDRLGVDAGIIFSDILIPVEAMGMKLELGDHGPKLHDPLRAPADVDRLHGFDPEVETGSLMEAIRSTVKGLSGRVPLIGFCGAPFTLASYMIEGGGSKSFLLAKRFLYEQPKAAHKLFGLLADTLGTYLAAQVRAGASAVQIFDSWGGELSPADYAVWGVPYLQRIAQAVKREGAPLIMFATGSSGLLEVLKGVGADAMGLDWRIEIDAARARLGPDVAVQGNLDTIALFLPPEELEARVKDILKRAGPLGHIFNLGHGILPPTDPEAAKLLVELVHRHSERRDG
ncbi:MAG: uroporphyrinogen decarboxylase [Deltaproteobacteria bacterium]|nr:uroporphyrinogen decarboxylase [Deltaproteobacteria bacterium]